MQQMSYQEVSARNLASIKATGSKRDIGIMRVVTSLEDELQEKLIQYSQFNAALLGAFPGDIGQYIKPPAITVAARVDCRFKWITGNGVVQILDNGGYVVVSIKVIEQDNLGRPTKYEHDIWGVGDPYFHTYDFVDELDNPPDYYKRLIGYNITDVASLIPELSGRFELLPRDNAINGGMGMPGNYKPLRLAMKNAPALSFEATSSWNLYSPESSEEPHRIVPGMRIMIGALGETWAKSPDAFASQYEQVDSLALSNAEIAIFMQHVINGTLSIEELKKEAFKLYQRVRAFGTSGGAVVVKTGEYVRYTQTMQVVKL